MSIFHPQDWTAKRTFWPCLPIANDKWSSGTTTLEVLFLASISNTLVTEAGCKELAINSSGFSLHWYKSTFSPPKALTISLILAPPSPTHEPIASTSGEFE